MKNHLDTMLATALESARDAPFDQGLLRVVPNTSSLVVYRHVLGFLHIKLCEMGDLALRLHIWPRELLPSPPVWPVHDHVFHLTSIVVAGRIRNSSFAVEDAPSGSHQLYEVQYTETGSRRVRTTRRVDCRCTDKQEVLPGDVYEVPANHFHASESLDESTAITILQTQKVTQGSPRVVGDLAGADEYTYPLQAVAVAEVEAVLAECHRK